MKTLIVDQKDLSLLRTVDELRWRVRDLENRLIKPVDPRGHLPDLREITKLHAQLFDNRKHSSKQTGKKRSRAVQLQPARNIGEQRERR